MKNITLEQLSSFLTLSETLNYTKASSRLHISQSALSTQIKHLEEELGCILFLRSTRAVELSESGKFLQKKAKKILEEIDDLKNEVYKIEIGESGRINLGYWNVSSLAEIQDYLLEFQKRKPNVIVMPKLVQSIDRMLSLNNNLDCILLSFACVNHMDWANCIHLNQSGLSWIVNKEKHFDKKELTFEEIKDETLIIIERKIAPRYYDQVIADLAKAGFSFKKIIHVEANVSISSLVSMGYGISVIPTYISDEDDKVKKIEIPEIKQDYGLVLCYPTIHENPALYEFLQCLRK